jgi:hypothetical protein
VREHPAPNPVLLLQNRPRNYRLQLILHPPQSRHILKPNAAPAPLAILGEDILRYKNDPGGPADKLILTRFGFGRDKGKQGATVGRGDRHPPVAGLKLRIKGQSESELIRVESQALILISNVNVDSVNTQMGAVPIHAKTGPARSRR